MSAGTLVRRLAWALKSELIPLDVRLAEHSDAKLWSQPLASRRLLSGCMCCLVKQLEKVKKALKVLLFVTTELQMRICEEILNI